MANYSIKEVEHLSGIKAHTIRIWEKRYKIVEPKRTETNIRYYDDEDLKRILNVSVLNRYGYKISKIAELPQDKLYRELMNISHSNGNMEGQIENMIMAMIDFDETGFEKIFNKSVVNIGFEETIIQLVYPFFEKIGILWTTGNINPAQEHFISNLIRQKMIVAIDDLPKDTKGHSCNFVLFLPEGEWHELGLLFYYYIIKKNGHRITYLGRSLPLNCLEELEKHSPFTHIVTTVKTSIATEDVIGFLHQISSRFLNKSIFLLGTKCDRSRSELPSNIILPHNLQDFKNYLGKIS
ncbi:MAG: MerR family transcriptional regulator [bacterium]